MKSVQMDSHLRAILNTDAESMTSASKIRSETDLPQQQHASQHPAPKPEASAPPSVTVAPSAPQRY